MAGPLYRPGRAAFHTARTDDGRSLTFDTRARAERYLERASADIQRGRWQSPQQARAAVTAPPTVRAYSQAWLDGRTLADRTRNDCAQILRDHIWPALGSLPVTGLTPSAVRAWHSALRTGPTMRAHAYGLLRTMMTTAVADEMIPANPCRIRGAGTSRRVKQIRPATLPELQALTDAMPERYRLMTLLAAWCALRFGELTELRRSDIDVQAGVIRVRRGVVRVPGGRKVKGPKSDAGRRDVNIPPHLMPAVKAHLREHVNASPQALLFPAAHGGHMNPSSLQTVYYPARKAAGRPDLRFHDLRHTGATLAAATGATLADLMGFRGRVRHGT